MNKPRLIDANALKEKLYIADDNWNPVVTAKEIDEMPTAYNVEGVVERLEEKQSGAIFERATQECNESYLTGLIKGYGEAIEIVKGGAE